MLIVSLEAMCFERLNRANAILPPINASLVVSRATGQQRVNGLRASNAKGRRLLLIFLHSIVVGLAMEKR